MRSYAAPSASHDSALPASPRSAACRHIKRLVDVLHVNCSASAVSSWPFKLKSLNSQGLVSFPLIVAWTCPR